MGHSKINMQLTVNFLSAPPPPPPRSVLLATTDLPSLLLENQVIPTKSSDSHPPGDSDPYVVYSDCEHGFHSLNESLDD